MNLDELKTEVSGGAIDTVLLAITDMQGRLMGKRLVAKHFVEDVAAHGAEGCNYLLAVDVDMTPVSGFAMASWERGYGDFLMQPDLDTLRIVPWQEGTAVCIADLAWLDGSEVLASPRQILRRQLARLKERLPRQLRVRVAQGLPGSRSSESLQRRLLAARHGTRRAADPPDPQFHGRR